MCEWGTEVAVYVRIPADLSSTGKASWKIVGIDACIAPLVEALQNGGINMRGSCCGHGKGPGEIVLDDGRTLRIESAEVRPRAQSLAEKKAVGRLRSRFLPPQVARLRSKEGK